MDSNGIRSHAPYGGAVRVWSVLLLIAMSGCRFEITTPSPNVTVNNNNANTNNNDNTNNVSPVSPIVVIPTPPTTIPPGNTTPPSTTPVSLPVSAQATITALGQQYSALVVNCDYLFIDALLTSLRVTDTRWGYVCKRGNCSDISQDVIAYFASSGTGIRGSTGTYEIDVIGASCSPTAIPQYLNYGYGPTNVFTPTRTQ